MHVSNIVYFTVMRHDMAKQWSSEVLMTFRKQLTCASYFPHLQQLVQNVGTPLLAEAGTPDADSLYPPVTSQHTCDYVCTHDGHQIALPHGDPELSVLVKTNQYAAQCSTIKQVQCCLPLMCLLCNFQQQ